MSLRRMMRNARRATNYNLPGQLREGVSLVTIARQLDKSGPEDLYVGLNKGERVLLADQQPKSEVPDGDEA